MAKPNIDTTESVTPPAETPENSSEVDAGKVATPPAVITVEAFNSAKNAKNLARERLTVYFDTFEVEDVDALLAVDGLPERVKVLAEDARSAMGVFNDFLTRAPDSVIAEAFTAMDKRDSFNLASLAHTEAEAEIRALYERHNAEIVEAFARHIPAVCRTAGMPVSVLSGMGIPSVGVITSVSANGDVVITPNEDSASMGKRRLRIGYARNGKSEAE